MVAWKTFGLAAFAAAATVVNADATKCDANNKCPKDKPCCDQYGECGTGMKCLGGCDPQSSFDLKSCMPMPVCKDEKYSFDSTDSMEDIHKFLGDAEKYPWVYTGKVLEYSADKSVLIAMPKDSVGTVLSSTRYLWYGNIKATMKTSRDAGVITDFILMSNVKDEIDYEFVGNDLTHAQTNYYYQGILNYDKQNKAEISDSYENYHTYEVDWTEDQIQWIIDGETVRSLKKSDTYNETTKQYNYPQTPARLQLGIWPGGASSQGQGTIDWAGGPIDWDSEDIKKNGYYSAAVKSVEVKCYDPPSDTKKSGSKAYIYTSRDGYNKDIEITDDDTILYDMENSGDNNKSKSIADASQVSSSTKSIADASEVKSSTKKAKATSTGKSDSKSTGGASASSTGGSSSNDDGGFSQGGDDDSSSSSDSSASGSQAAATTASSNQAAAGYVVPSLMTVVGFVYALL